MFLKYVTEYNLKHVTTGEIMKMALERGFLTENQGNTIWAEMLSKKRRLGYNTFSQYLSEYRE